MKLEATGPLANARIEEPIAAEDVVVVGATAGKRVRPLAGVLSTAAGTTVNFHQGGASISGNLIMPANTTLVLDPTGFGWADTDVGSPLLMNTTAGVSGTIRYQTIN